MIYDVTTYGATGDGTDDTTEVQAAFAAAITAGGGTVYFPRGTYNLANWSTGGLAITVPLTVTGEEGAALLGPTSSGAPTAHLFDFFEEFTVQDLEMRDWRRGIQFWRVGDIANTAEAEFVRVTGCGFHDVRYCLEGHRFSGSHSDTGHQIREVVIRGNRCFNARSFLNFSRIRIGTIYVEDNEIVDLAKVLPDTDSTTTVGHAIKIGSSSDTPVERETITWVRRNRILNAENASGTSDKDMYAIIVYRGPDVVEDNDIENVTTGSGGPCAGIYSRSSHTAVVRNNRLTDCSNTSNVAAIIAKKDNTLELRVTGNHVVYTDAYKTLWGALDYDGIELNKMTAFIEANTVEGASTAVRCRMEDSNNDATKPVLRIVDNAFRECIPQTGNYVLFLGYKASELRVERNAFVDCWAGGAPTIFVSSEDEFHKTDLLVIADNNQAGTAAVSPGRWLYLNSMAKQSELRGNNLAFASSDYTTVGVAQWIFINANAGVAVDPAAYRLVIHDNTFDGLLQTSTTHGIESHAAYGLFDMQGNRFRRGKSHARFEDAMPTTVRIRGNRFENLSGAVFSNPDPLALNTVQVCANEGLVTRNQGGGTITTAATSVTVTHGIAAIDGTVLEAQDVQLTLTGSPGAAKAIWVSAVTSTTFTVTCDVAPGTSLNFNWAARSRFARQD